MLEPDLQHRDIFYRLYLTIFIMTTTHQVDDHGAEEEADAAHDLAGGDALAADYRREDLSE